MKISIIKKGFTLIELVVVIAIISLISAVSIISVAGYIEESQLTVDRTTVKTLNTVSRLYGIKNDTLKSDIFMGYETNEQRLQQLVNDGLLNNVIVPKHKDSEFSWLINEQLWVLINDGVMTPLTSLGSTFDEISVAIISKINDYYLDNNHYGRTWGDYRYTDIGLEPDEWNIPISHVHYKPSGRLLRISPEDGYHFEVDNENGVTRILTSDSNWDLIYNVEDNNWYYHSISEDNIIDISSLKINN
ncbi:MAG: prepilin-type N-terminal cleavage/methylation domain-containing protein [Erysipelotrichaceae bacterium]|nr:prepilin-type N-terminal cleavage/methylation domain-containing protein [Erysipelotrichaceae bacterium]MDD3924444.1 prepilin-type N-terminal cleavage/methylation domain-containing protein [Erysipelotrichaceae bacterium]